MNTSAMNIQGRSQDNNDRDGNLKDATPKSFKISNNFISYISNNVSFNDVIGPKTAKERTFN